LLLNVAAVMVAGDPLFDLRYHLSARSRKVAIVASANVAGGWSGIDPST
jgi:hypothetical protein